MKKLNIYLILLLMAVSLMWSCEDYLNSPPEATVSQEDVFSTYLNFQAFVDQEYEKIVDYNGHAICVSQNLGGEAIAVQGWTCSYMASKGDYWSIAAGTTGRSNYIGYNNQGIWDYSWQGIRIANLGLENIESLTNATADEKKLLLGQLYFFRAFHHWEIARAYGTIPYIDKVLDDEFKLPRHWEYNGKKDYQAVTEKIVEDLDLAAANLPEVWDNYNANAGRVTKGAALALKAKALLYAGSPLMNQYSGGTVDFNKDYMKRAAEAAAEVLKLADKGVYSLLPFSDYQRMFATIDGDMPFTSETIFQRHKNDVGSGEATVKQGRLYFPDQGTFGGNAITETPTQNFVDLFEMADGTKYITGGSDVGGYDYDNSKRWNGRDPRFRKAIYVDGDMAGINAATKLTLYDGGTTRTKSSMLCPYVVHKFWPLGANKKDQQWNEFRYVTPHLRLAEMYLIYAEAIYEATGDANQTASNYTMKAFEAVNKVRDRAGMGPVTATPAAYGGSFRDLVRNERAVELCFEGNYWFDIRRWKETPFPQLMTMKFNKAYTYFNREVVTPFVFEERHYWLPFPRELTYMYKEFDQNPGW